VFRFLVVWSIGVSLNRPRIRMPDPSPFLSPSGSVPGRLYAAECRRPWHRVPVPKALMAVAVLRGSGTGGLRRPVGRSVGRLWYHSVQAGHGCCSQRSRRGRGIGS
jgi:hypothetical protein